MMMRRRHLGALLAASALAAGLAACVPTPRAAQPQAPAAGGALDGQQPVSSGSGSTGSGPIESPVRPARPQQQLSLPELADSSSELPSLTFELETVSQSSALGARRTVTRTPTLAHVQPHGSQSEWLFARNPVDGRRVSAMQIDHHHRAIIEFSDSELRNANIVRGWADVAYLGVDLAVLRRMSPTGRREALSGFQFEELTPSAGDGSSLWWSSAAGAPLRIRDAGARQEVSLRALRTSVDASLLEDPRRRFPGYAVLDVADFREKHHEQGGH